MADHQPLYAASACAAVALAMLWEWRRSKARPPYPPGPKGWPLLGNALDVPKDVPIWQTFTSLARKFNTDVLYLRVFTTDMIILNTPEVISDLADKRSNKYSGRPWSPMLDLMGQYSWNVGFIPYGPLWKNSRRVLHEFLNAKVVNKLDDYQRKHAHRLLLNLFESPEDFLHHIEFLVGALVMEMTYGVNIRNNEDRFLRAAVETLDVTNRALVPGGFLVDTIPILRYVPEWFPGAGFKTFARIARGQLDTAINGPLEYVKESMKSGESGNPSIAWSCFDRTLESSNRTYDEDAVRSATGTIFVAAVDTTVAILDTFFFAMALNPHVVRKAQQELDRVLGSGRLPDFDDEEDLPYISAVMKEVIRWGCPVPFGLPKKVTEDDVYNGRFIPAGATVVENVWAMLYDESIYPDPHIYDPERFLKDGKIDPSVRKPEERIFGSGRRICPGQHFAMRTLFLNIACVLTIFNFEVPAGEKIEVKFFEGGFARHPVSFKCTIRPRSEANLTLLQSLSATIDH